MQTCANCGRTIGDLETAYDHGKAVVCGPCKQRLLAARAGADRGNSRHNSAAPAIISIVGGALVAFALMYRQRVGVVSSGDPALRAVSIAGVFGLIVFVVGVVMFVRVRLQQGD